MHEHAAEDVDAREQHGGREAEAQRRRDGLLVGDDEVRRKRRPAHHQRPHHHHPKPLATPQSTKLSFRAACFACAPELMLRSS